MRSAMKRRKFLFFSTFLFNSQWCARYCYMSTESAITFFVFFFLSFACLKISFVGVIALYDVDYVTSRCIYVFIYRHYKKKVFVSFFGARIGIHTPLNQSITVWQLQISIGHRLGKQFFSLHNSWFVCLFFYHADCVTQYHKFK